MNIIQVFFQMLLNIKLYHWETKIYARHVASDNLHGELSTLIDSFIEIYIAGMSRPKFTNGFTVSVKQLTDTTVIERINEYITLLKKDLPKILNKDDTHLLNIRDEMLAILNKTVYLFSLR